MKEKLETKQRVFEAAIALFNTNGYNGTSVRDIAKKAGVNVSLISYYFGGKKGLLECLMTQYLEGYLRVMGEVFEQHEQLSAQESLQVLSYNILKYEAEFYHLSRLVFRETTVDTFLTREIMTTYLSKETFYLKTIIEIGMNNNEFRKKPIMIAVMQLKSMLNMPYSNPQYLIEVLHIHPKEQYFIESYFKEIKIWISEDLCKKTNESPRFIPITQTM